MASVEIETPHGVARAHLHLLPRPRAALILGHGAGGGVGAPDLVAVSEAAQARGISVVLVEQPYRVAGRRTPAAVGQLDAAWVAVIERLRVTEVGGLPLVVGGRSLGARVACRTAGLTNTIGILCLAFPLQPPQRQGKAPAPSRIGELDAVAAPTLVVQGDRDPFGIPPAAPRRMVVQVRGDHSLRTDLGAVGEVAASWLAELIASSART